MSGKQAKDHEEDERADAWERFESAVDIALHTPPKKSPSKKKAAQSKGRKKKAKPNPHS